MKSRIFENGDVLFIDQYGRKIMANSVKDLREKAGGGRVFKIYRDVADGTVHVGYGIGRSWFNAFAPIRIKV